MKKLVLIAALLLSSPAAAQIINQGGSSLVTGGGGVASGPVALLKQTEQNDGSTFTIVGKSTLDFDHAVAVQYRHLPGIAGRAAGFTDLALTYTDYFADHGLVHNESKLITSRRLYDGDSLYVRVTVATVDSSVVLDVVERGYLIDHGSIPLTYAETFAGVDFTTATYSINTRQADDHSVELLYLYVPGPISLADGKVRGVLTALVSPEQEESNWVKSYTLSGAIGTIELASGDSLYLQMTLTFADHAITYNAPYLIDHNTSLKWRLYVDPWGDAGTHIVSGDSLTAWGATDTTIIQPTSTDDYWLGHFDLLAGANRGVRATSTGNNSGILFNTLTSTMPDYVNNSRLGYVGWNLDDLQGKRVLQAHFTVGWGGPMSNNASQQIYAIIDTLSADSLRSAPNSLNTSYHTKYWRSTSAKFMHEADTDTASTDDGDAANVAWQPTIASRTSSADYGIICPRPLDEDYTADSVVYFDVTSALNTALNIGVGPQAFWISGTPRGLSGLNWDIGDDGATAVNMGPVLTVAYIEEDDPPDPYLGMLKWGNSPTWNDYFYDAAARGGVYVGQVWDLWDENANNEHLVDSLRVRQPDIKAVGYALSLAVNHGQLLSPSAGLLGDIHKLAGRHLVYTVDQDTFLHWQYDKSAPTAISDYDHYMMNYVECPTLSDSLAILYKQYFDTSTNNDTGVGIYIDTVDFPILSAMYADTTSPRWGSNDVGKLLYRGAADMDQDGVPHDIDADEKAAFLAAMIELPDRMKAILDMPVVMNGYLPYQYSAMRTELDGHVFDGYPLAWNQTDAQKPYNRSMDMRVDDPDSSWTAANAWPSAVGVNEWSPITEGVYEQVSDMTTGNISVMLPYKWEANNRAYIPAATIIARMFASAGGGPYVTYSLKNELTSAMAKRVVWHADFGDPVGPVVCSDPDGKMEAGDTITRQFERGTLVITQGDGTLASPFAWSFTWR